MIVSCEPIAYSGADHLVIRVTSDGAGGFYDAFHRNILVTGTGLTSGTSYILNAEIDMNEHVAATSTVPYTFTSVGTNVFVSQGSLPNADVEDINHLTIDANGNITADIFEFRGACRG